MTTATLFSTVSQNENAAGPFVPTPTIVNAGAPVTRWNVVVTVTPATGWCEVNVLAGPDGVNFPTQCVVYAAPGAGTGSYGLRGGSVGADSPQAAMQYFQAEVLKISPNTTATATITY